MGSISSETLEQLPPILKDIDEKLVVLEQERQNADLVSQLKDHLDTFTETAQGQLQLTPLLTDTMARFLHGVTKGKNTLSSPAFEKLFNAVVLLQEQLEWSAEHGSEVQGTQWDPLLTQLEALASGKEIPAPVSATVPAPAPVPIPFSTTLFFKESNRIPRPSSAMVIKK